MHRKVGKEVFFLDGETVLFFAIIENRKRHSFSNIGYGKTKKHLADRCVIKYSYRKHLFFWQHFIIICQIAAPPLFLPRAQQQIRTRKAHSRKETPHPTKPRCTQPSSAKNCTPSPTSPKSCAHDPLCPLVDTVVESNLRYSNLYAISTCRRGGLGKTDF